MESTKKRKTDEALTPKWAYVHIFIPDQMWRVEVMPANTPIQHAETEIRTKSQGETSSLLAQQSFVVGRGVYDINSLDDSDLLNATVVSTQTLLQLSANKEIPAVTFIFHSQTAAAQPVPLCDYYKIIKFNPPPQSSQLGVPG